MAQLQQVAGELNAGVGKPKIGELPLTRAFTKRAEQVGDPVSRWAH